MAKKVALSNLCYLKKKKKGYKIYHTKCSANIGNSSVGFLFMFMFSADITPACNQCKQIDPTTKQPTMPLLFRLASSSVS